MPSVEPYSIMNESNKRCCTDLRQVDNQIYHELDQAVDEFKRDKEIYNELNRPGERNNRYYYEVTTNNGESYYSELSQHNAAGDHTSCKLHQSNDQQVSFASVDKKLQLNSKIQFFLTLLLTVLFLLGISAVLIAVMFTKGSSNCKENPANVLLENITENMHHLVNQQSMCSKNTVNLIQQSSENSTQKLINIVSTLNNLKDTYISTAGVVDDILLMVEELLEIQNASVLFSIQAPISCKDIKKVLPNSPTGYYHVNSRNIYCNMGELCGTGGGWTRLAYLDMSDSTVNCPTGFKLYESNGVRACGRTTSGGSCQSVKFPSNGVSYSQVCGRVVGYQYGSTDASYVYNDRVNHDDINSYYVDGVSITHGYPRQHIWTLMAGLLQSYLNENVNCPCSQGSLQNTTLQSFIENDYFCESGNPSTHGGFKTKLYTQDPLWDGKGCGSLEEACCSAPGLPWFHKVLNSTTTDYIELRVCGDQSRNDEDVPVSFYEIYIK